MAIGNHGGEASRQSSPFTRSSAGKRDFYREGTDISMQEMLCSPLITQTLAAAALITCICRLLPRGIR